MKINQIPSKYILILILLLGVFLRLYQLGKEDIWLDEAVSINYNASGPFHDLIEGLIDRDSNPPLYFILLHYWLKLGMGSFTIRLLSALIGIFSIPIFYLLAKELFSEKSTLLATLFWSTSVYHLFYSQEVRMYSLQVLLVLCMMYFFYRILITNGSSYYLWLGYILFSVAGIYTQYFTIFILFAQGIILTALFFKHKIIQKKVFFGWLICQGIIFICSTPLIYLIKNQKLASNTAWIPKTHIGDILNIPFHFLLGGNILIPKTAIILSIIAFCIWIYSVWRNRKGLRIKWESNKIELTLLTCWLIVPTLLFIAVSFIKPIFLIDRYLIISLPAFFLLLVFFLEQAIPPKQKWVFTGILFISIGISLVSYYRQEKKIPFHIPVKIIQASETDRDLLLFIPAWQYPGFQHYFRGQAPLYEKSEMRGIFYTGQFYQMWVKSSEHPDRIWFLTVDYSDRELLEFLQSKYKSSQQIWNYKSPITADAQLLLFKELIE